MKSKTFATMIFMSAVVLQAAHALKAEPDWSNRFLAVKAEIASSFSPAKVGSRITIMRRIGGPHTGRLDEISEDSVTIDGKRYEARQLTDETCGQLFANFHAAQKARVQVLAERAAYRQRATAEKETRRLEEEQVAERRSIQSPVKPVRAQRATAMQPTQAASPVAPTERSEDTGAWKYILVVVGICCLPAITRRMRKSAQIDRAKKFLAAVKQRRGLSPISTSLYLRKGEQAFMEAACTLNETRAERQFQSGGIGFRVAKGVYIGGRRGRSVSIPKMTHIDTGCLTVTSKRLVFNGRMENRVIPLSKIISVNNFTNAIEIAIEGRQKSMYFTVPDPLIWATVIRIMSVVENPTDLNDASLDIKFG